MKKIYTLLVVFVMLPISGFTSSSHANVNSGMESISAAKPCGTGGG